MEKEKMPIFFIDCNVLKNMIEDKNVDGADKLLMKLKNMNDEKVKFQAATTLSSFLRAIYISDSSAKIGKIQKILSFIHIAPSMANIDNEVEVKNELMNLAQSASGGFK